MASTGLHKIEPQKIDFGKDGNAELQKFVKDNLCSQLEQWRGFHEEKIPHYKKLYDGTPRETIKSFPWRNASNIVVQVIGQHVDTLKAKIISSIYELSPLWPISVLGKSDDIEQAEEKREALEEFLTHAGLSPEELDFYRVENLWCSDVLRYGMGVIKAVPTEELEQQIYLMGGAEFKKPLLKNTGPRFENIRLADFTCTVTVNNIKKSLFTTHCSRLTKYQLEERKYTGAYDKNAVDKILKIPDRNAPSAELIEEYNTKSLNLNDLYNTGEWHVYECWFPFWWQGKKYRIIYTYHKGSDTMLRAVYNFYPENESAFIVARLGHNDNGIIGKGFAELLEDYQEEVTAGHNQRVDNRTIANTSIIRVGKNTRFDSQFSFYPNMTVPADQGEIEAIQFGAIYPNSVNEEMLTLKLAEDRSGVGASTSGMGGLGSGTVGKTSGAYSSMGTMSVMQDGNRNVGANITDFKYAHMEAGRMAANMFAHFGTDGKEYLFGNDADLILEALEAISTKKLGFDVKAATASINKEVEKQNYLLLTGILQRHYTAVGQMIQAANSQMVDPVLRDYLIKTIKGSDQLMGKVLASFDIEDRSRILPEPQLTAPQGAAQNGPTIVTRGAAGATPTAATSNPMGETNSTQGSITSPNVIARVSEPGSIPG